MTEQCSAEGCERAAATLGMCGMHYRRMARNGTLEVKRPADWGQRRKRPEHRFWALTKRSGRAPEWDDFWAFFRDVGERPSLDHSFVRKDKSRPFGPDNFEWLAPLGSCERAARERQKHREEERNRRVKGKVNRARGGMLKRLFGLTEAQFHEMERAQGFGCKICGKRSRDRALSVDHCHETGVVRGLLCTKCNTGLGMFGDDEARMLMAAEYIRAARIKKAA